MTATVQLSLPFPISVNALYRTYRGRPVLSPRYRVWKTEAAWDIKIQKPARISGPVHIHIALLAPDRRKRDADNLAKCVLDALVAGGVIDGDDNGTVLWTHPEWVEEGRPCVVTITAAQKQQVAA